ncbi:MAG: 23S rRNA (pseudouridine(1915)-N(3))-methyltransferase RlmH [Rhodospirillaceae bacterium]|nr:23S rRNA (pseudouridine(1915)-N(3))-methyltransferase RlmH [Rhodospirillaceae bacterium]HAA93970.1 23S rRNA (pseudouridine(1915)-N(3))-methyltransferase RlmH [Rhodospirillaceae bacterium]|tara:strand:+ start:743 stop:1204 length:462 start_codon:yes stop_codon:yes gene_type:complete
MRILIAAIGRFRAGPERDLFQTYIERSRWAVELKELDLKGKTNESQRKTKESALLAEAIPDGAITVALDEKGKALTSNEFARKIGSWQSDGRSSFVFLIGGADGLTDDLRRRADLVMSFGAATWPHMLVRPMLAEQLYRAETILAGHPYHRRG